MRIQGKMTNEEFENVCKNKGITNTFEISKRYDNYLMSYKGMNDGRTLHEVGANIREEDLYED